MTEQDPNQTPPAPANVGHLQDGMTEQDPNQTQPTPPGGRATLRFGLGQRELTRISILFGLLIVAGLGFAGYRFMMNFKYQRDILTSQDNLLSLWKAINSYAEDYDRKMPPAANWTDRIGGYLSAPPGSVGGRLAALHCDGDNGEKVGYVFNDLIGDYLLDQTGPHARHLDLSRVVVLFERPGAPLNAHLYIPLQDDTPQALHALAKQLSFPHFAADKDNATTVALYADGSIRRIKHIALTQMGE